MFICLWHITHKAGFYDGSDDLWFLGSLWFHDPSPGGLRPSNPLLQVLLWSCWTWRCFRLHAWWVGQIGDATSWAWQYFLWGLCGCWFASHLPGAWTKKTQVGWFFSTRQVKVFRFYQIHRASVFSFSMVSRTWFLTCPLSPSPPLAPPLALLLVTHTSHPLPPNLPSHMSCASHQLPSQPKGPYPPCDLLRTLYFSCGSMIVAPPPT